MSTYGLDPNALMDVICVHSANAAGSAGAAFKLPDGKRIDIGKYEYVTLLYLNCGGTSTGTSTLVPRESDSQAGPEFPLDGTNGAPDFSRSFPTATISGVNASRQVTIRTRGRRQFLNVVLTVSASGTARIGIYLLGFKKITSVLQSIETNLGLQGPIA